MAKKTEKNEKEKTTVVGAPEKEVCNDRNCPTHGTLSIRGRTFEGTVIKKFPKRITIAFERNSYVRKYERYIKYTSKIHARLPVCMDKEINVGDYVQIMECKPLSKIIHFVVVKKIREAEANASKIKEKKK